MMFSRISFQNIVSFLFLLACGKLVAQEQVGQLHLSAISLSLGAALCTSNGDKHPDFIIVSRDLIKESFKQLEKATVQVITGDRLFVIAQALIKAGKPQPLGCKDIPKSLLIDIYSHQYQIFKFKIENAEETDDSVFYIDLSKADFIHFTVTMLIATASYSLMSLGNTNFYIKAIVSSLLTAISASSPVAILQLSQDTYFSANEMFEPAKYYFYNLLKKMKQTLSKPKK